MLGCNQYSERVKNLTAIYILEGEKIVRQVTIYILEWG